VIDHARTMKRSAALIPLSHDHHQALFVAQRLKRAEHAEEERERFLSFWNTHGESHFEIEEQVLLPGWLEADPDADARLAARLASDHLAIRTAARRLGRGAIEPQQLHDLGLLLERHVRFEERELFPLIESRLDAEAIARIGAEIAAAEE
jgi:hemerythrin-like domain-containing protein